MVSSFCHGLGSTDGMIVWPKEGRASPMTKAGPGTNIRALHSGDVRMCCPRHDADDSEAKPPARTARQHDAMRSSHSIARIQSLPSPRKYSQDNNRLD